MIVYLNIQVIVIGFILFYFEVKKNEKISEMLHILVLVIIFLKETFAKIWFPLNAHSLTDLNTNATMEVYVW